MVYINNTKIIKLILEDCPINYANIVMQITLLSNNCKQIAKFTLSTAIEHKIDCHWWINVNDNVIVLNIGWTNQSIKKIEL